MPKVLAVMKDDLCINVLQFDDDCPQGIMDFVLSEQGGDKYIDTAGQIEWGVGCTWHTDHFRPPKPYPSWVWLNETKEYTRPHPVTGEINTLISYPHWVAPIPEPEDINEVNYMWDEENQNWVKVE